MSEKKPEVLFLDVGEEAPSEIESMCMACGENGTTKILLTRIPHFKEVILMAFECPHCGLRNNEIQSGQSIAEKGLVARCSIKNARDLNRQLVRSEFATVVIPEIDFESPPTARNGSLTTIEGILQKVYDGLSAEQPIRKYDSPEEYEKIEAFLVRLNQLKELETPFTVEVRDPSGNSYLENLCAPKEDPQIVVTHYERSEAENEFLGLAKPALEGEEEEEPPRDAIDEIRDSVMEFPSNCSNCNVPVICKMHMIDIPFFKDVIIMATACDNCGFKSSEVKSGGAISPKGKKITLKVVDRDDLSRDILKSESCKIEIPEIELELTPGTLGGRFTTVEGLLQQVYDQMEERNPFHYGDSAPKGESPLDKFLVKLKTVIQADIPFTLIMDDCLGSSYLQNLYAPDPDPNMTIEEYERTWEQNDDWGLNDLVENPEEHENDDK